MKKSILTLGILGVLTLGGSIIASASETTNTESTCGVGRNGTTYVQQLMNEGKSFEDAKKEILERNYSRVDAAVERGTITKERGEEIKAEMKANSNNCTTPGANKNNHPRYGLNKGLGNKGNCVINNSENSK